MSWQRSRGIHAARPTPRRLRSACTQVAICGVWTFARLEARSRSTANTAVCLDAFPVGDAGGHDGTGRDSDEAVDQPGRYLMRYRFVRSRPGLSHSSSSSHRVSCAAGNLDTPPNSGAADRALANARSVSPSASYLKGHQVTKCPCSWWVPPSSEYPHFGDAPWARAERTSMSWQRSRGIHAARPTPRRLRSACTQVAICGVRTGAHIEVRSRSTANTAVCPDATLVGDAGAVRRQRGGGSVSR
jgi:hypothetical protein